jgi:pyruvate dehydrogenase E2 component (dihydrolipoamide acetyltransferase)
VFTDLPPASSGGKPIQQIEDFAQSSVWKLMAERTTKSWTQVPHFYLSRELNAGRLVCWRERILRIPGKKITYTDLIIKLVAAVLTRHPRLNSRWQDSRIVLNEDINIGVAVAIKDGLIVPVIARADTLSLSTLALRRQDLVSRAQERKLRVDELQNGTFTVSNLGMYGVDSFLPILNSPQSAILGVGRIAEKVVVCNHQPSVQPCMTLTLSCDHRAVDGATAASFLKDLVDFIEEPLSLID